MSRNEPHVSRRDFARLLATEEWLGVSPRARRCLASAAATDARSARRRVLAVGSQQFLMPPELGILNAANLCPSPAPVLEAMYRSTKDIDGDPSFDNRQKMSAGKEETRRLVASFLGVTPEEIVLTRNTSEANNMVSSGLDLKAGDEVIVFADNHPSNNDAWTQKAKRFGYAVTTIRQPNPHPGPEYYVDAVRKAITSRTRVLAFTHHTSTVGDVLPAKELCLIARERGVMTLVDGACTFGMLDLDLTDIQPDFYTGSSHKWPCGPKEVGVLYVNARVQASIPRASSAPIPARSASRAPGSDGTARRARHHRLRRGDHLPDQDRPQGHRRAVALARPGTDCRTPPHRWRAALDASGSIAIRCGRQLPAGNLGCDEALGRALPQRSHRLCDSRRNGSTWHPFFAAHLQHDGGSRSLSGGAQRSANMRQGV